MNTEPDSLMPGTLLAGRYRLAGVIGKGGFGAVFRATALATGASVAIKVLSRSALEQSGGVERFRREATLASRLKHPNTVRVLDAGEDAQGWLFIVFELLEGESVEQALAERGAMSVERAASLVSEVLSALEEAHSLAIVHRDLKPGNIFLVQDGRGREGVKVLDFGIAKSTTPETKVGLTRDGSTMGTPMYMSPEQILGQAVSPASDLYTMGIVLAEMVLGVSPYGRDPHTLEVITQRINGKPVPLPDDLASSRVGAIIVRATQPDPTRRFRSASEMRAALIALAPTVTSPHSLGYVVSPMATAATEEHRAVVRRQIPAHLASTVPSEPSNRFFDAQAPATVRDPSGASLPHPSPGPFAVSAPAPPKKKSIAGVLLAVGLVVAALGAAAAVVFYLQPGPLKELFGQPKPRKKPHAEAVQPESTNDAPRSNATASAKPLDRPSSATPGSSAAPAPVPAANQTACPRVDSLSASALEAELAREGITVKRHDHACSGSEVQTDDVVRCDGRSVDTYTVEGGAVRLRGGLAKADIDALLGRPDEEPGASTFAVGTTQLLVSTLPPPGTRSLLTAICGRN